MGLLLQAPLACWPDGLVVVAPIFHFTATEDDEPITSYVNMVTLRSTDREQMKDLTFRKVKQLVAQHITANSSKERLSCRRPPHLENKVNSFQVSKPEKTDGLNEVKKRLDQTPYQLPHNARHPSPRV